MSIDRKVSGSVFTLTTYSSVGWARLLARAHTRMAGAARSKPVPVMVAARHSARPRVRQSVSASRSRTRKTSAVAMVAMAAV